MEAQITNMASNEVQDTDVELSRWVTFRIGEEVYGIPVNQTKEVLRVTEIAPVPGAPAYVLGIINLRGNVVTVVDMRTRLGMPYQEPTDLTRIIILEASDQVAGILVDSIREVVQLDKSAVEPAPNTGSDADDIINGVAHHNDQLLIMLDAYRMLGVDHNSL